MLLKQPNHKPLKLVITQISITSYSLVPTLPTWKEREKEGREERGDSRLLLPNPQIEQT